MNATGPTLAEKFCAHHRLPLDRFVDAMFWRCLHRRAWPLASVLPLLNPHYFQADYDLLHAVAKITSLEQLEEELQDFYSHPGNYSRMRRQFRFRISGRRVARIARRFLPGKLAAGADSRAPI